MLRALNTAILAALVFLVGVIAFVILESPPSAEDLDADIATIRQGVKQASDARQKYEGGAIKAFMDLNHEILVTTESMLQQKRLSVLRHIKIDYRIDGKVLQPASAETLKAIESERAEAQRKADAAQAEVERYSGGLVQAMALMKAETEKLSVSVLNLKYYSAKYGMGLALPSFAPDSLTPSAPKEAPGRVVKDKDAL
jgi:hypothetical protein